MQTRNLSGGLQLAIVLMVATAPTRDAHADAETARAVATAWVAHRESFAHFTCRYTMTKGVADSRAAALDRRITRDFVAEVVWSVDGSRERASCVAKDVKEAPPLKGASSGNVGSDTIAIPGFADEHFIRAPDIFGHGSGQPMSVLTLFPSNQPGANGNSIATPFSLGVMGPGGSQDVLVRVNESIEHGAFVSGALTSAHDAVIELRETPGAKPFQIMHFAPDEGMRMKSSFARRMQGGAVECVVLEVMKTPSGWFPTYVVRLDTTTDNDPIIVREFDVTELRVDVPLQESDFHVNMESGGQFNAVGVDGSITTKDRVVVTPESLEDWFHRLEVQGQELNVYVAAKESITSSSRRWWFIAAGAVLALGAVWSLLRLRRARDG